MPLQLCRKNSSSSSSSSSEKREEGRRTENTAWSLQAIKDATAALQKEQQQQQQQQREERRRKENGEHSMVTASQHCHFRRKPILPDHFRCRVAVRRIDKSPAVPRIWPAAKAVKHFHTNGSPTDLQSVSSADSRTDRSLHNYGPRNCRKNLFTEECANTTRTCRGW